MDPTVARSMLLACAIALAPPGGAHAFTPAQSAALTAKTQSETAARLKAAALVRAQALASIKAKSATVDQAKTLLRVKLAVQAETQRRVVAATQAAEANAAVLAAAQPHIQTTLPTHPTRVATSKPRGAQFAAHPPHLHGFGSHAHAAGSSGGASHAGTGGHR